MSDSDNFTTTAYYDLFKPIAGMDVGLWGVHWNTNADTLDTALATHDDTLASHTTTLSTHETRLDSLSGVFLPLAGGTVTGKVTFNVGIAIPSAQTGGAFASPLDLTGTLSGTKSSGNLGFMRNHIASDTMSAASGGMTQFQLEYHGGGAGAVGNRVGLNIDFTFAGGTTNKGLGVGNSYAGFQSYARATGNVGGATGAGNAWGTLWGGLSSATLQSGATFWATCCGHEVNAGIATGASATRLQGFKVMLRTNAQTMNVATDYMIGMAMAANTDKPVPTGISFGSDDGYWPIRADGRLIGTIRPDASLPGQPQHETAVGIDFEDVTFTDAFLRSTNFKVDGLGYLLPRLRDAATDAAAATLGVPIGALYRTAGAIKVRLA